MDPVANTLDRDDPNNYVSFDDFAAGSAPVWSSEHLASLWNASHPGDQVHVNFGSIVPPGAIRTAVIPETNSGLTRVFAAVQLVGGGLELIVAGGALLAPEPTGVTKVAGVVVLLHGLDTIQSSIRTIVSGERTATFTQAGATWAARSAGAGPQTAQTIGIVTDVTIGVGGTFAVGSLTRLAPGAGQLVHLTSADSAAAIRGSETLGLGRSTIYAGPAALAQARGWSIVARTGILPGQASEVILLPSQANRAFLVVQPMGPFSLWQRLSGTVFTAGTGSFNLATGVFTRSGIAVNQLGIYGVDTVIMATVRGAPGIIDATNQ